MAWPHKLYVATRTLGVYYTDNFSGPGTQPTWTAVNGGLPATDVRQFALDPFAPAVKQYVLLETARTLYRRDNGGSWAAILTSAQADTLCSGSNGYISHFWVDQTVDGRIWALYGGNGGDGVVIFALYSSDYGATWAAATRITTSGVSERIPQGITAAGDIVFVQFLRGDGNRYARSVNKGATWYEAGLGYSSTTITANPLQTDRAYSSNSGGLILYTTGADPTNINASVGLTRADSMWFSAISAAHHRCIYNGKLYATTDSWSSNNSPSSISPAPLSIAPRAGADENQILVELTLDTNPNGGLQGHVIGCLYGEDDTTAVGIAGTNCETAPYTDAIPMTCGGAAVGGIAAVYEGNPIRLLSITRKTDLAEYASRVYPRGNGVSLVYTTRTASGEYTLDAAAGYIANGTAEALYGRRDSVQYFDISLPDSTGSESEQRVYGANALYDAALEWLGQHDSVATFYSIVVTGYDAPPKPGETIHVLTTTTVDGADVIEIDDDFNIVEASYGIDADGLPIATLEITDIERRAVNGERLLANAIVSAGRKSSGTGSTVTTLTSSASGTASIIGGEINGTTIGLLDPEAGRFTTLQVDGTADIAVIASGTATDGQVLTADGSGGAAWEDALGGYSLIVEEADGTPSVSGVTKIIVTNGTLTDNGSGEIELDFGSAATDGAAIHDNVANEISAITEKTTPADDDLLLIEDSADNYAKKSVKISNLPAGGGGAVATDAIWDAAGDLVYGTGANTASKLGIGTANQLLRVNSGATAPEWASVGRVLIGETVADGSAGTVTWSSIPATFRSLYIEWMGRSDKASSTSEALYIFFNNDTTAGNYRRIKFIGTGGNAYSITVSDDSYVGDLTAADATANMPASAYAKIIQYAGTVFHKQALVTYGLRKGATTHETGTISVQWENTDAISRVDLALPAGKFVSGSVFRLYGEY